MDYKATLNLPETAFPMKADLAKKEPDMLRGWADSKLYTRILEARRNAPPYVLHDGPPYANGHIHYGHILNKILKDIVCKYRTMAGHFVEYKPGWDCHARAGAQRGHLDDDAVDAAGQLGDRLPPRLSIRDRARQRRALHRGRTARRRRGRRLQARRGRAARAVCRREIRRAPRRAPSVP